MFKILLSTFFIGTAFAGQNQHWDSFEAEYKKTGISLIQYVKKLVDEVTPATEKHFKNKNKDAILYFISTGGKYGFRKEPATQEEREILEKSLVFCAMINHDLPEQPSIDIFQVRRSYVGSEKNVALDTHLHLNYVNEFLAQSQRVHCEYYMYLQIGLRNQWPFFLRYRELTGLDGLTDGRAIGVNSSKISSFTGKIQHYYEIVFNQIQKEDFKKVFYVFSNMGRIIFDEIINCDQRNELNEKFDFFLSKHGFFLSIRGCLISNILGQNIKNVGEGRMDICGISFKASDNRLTLKRQIETLSEILFECDSLNAYWR